LGGGSGGRNHFNFKALIMSCKSVRTAESAQFGAVGSRKTVPEPQGQQVTIAQDLTQAAKMQLMRGSYKISGFMENVGDSHLIEDEVRAIPVGDEYKRVYFHKVDVQPSEIRGEREGSRFTQVVTVLDNPLPLAPLVWAGSAVATLGSGWFFVDKVESFTETGTGQFLTIAAAVGGLVALYFTLQR
jgi:hypothetical protein